METNQNIKVLDFIPSENAQEVYAQVRAWLVERVLPHVQPTSRAFKDVERFEGGYMTITLGGYIPNPLDLDRLVLCEASLTVQVCADSRLVGYDRIVDAEGTTWYASGFDIGVGWPSYGGSIPLAVTRQRADMISHATQLACDFEARFKDVLVWTKGETRAQREEREADAVAKRALHESRVKVADAIREAIHTSCRGMRVGTERFIDARGCTAEGEYQVALENKEYTAWVGLCGGDLTLAFTRTK